jgi:N6-L-threonylcarbamoyladenine synthase
LRLYRLIKDLTFLGIETSCDETAAAVVRRRADGSGLILSNVIRAQFEQHRAFGGVVPELAARAHVECLDGIVAQALAESGMRLPQLDGIGVTAGPGLVGGLIVGVTTAKALAAVHALPLVPINHLEAHALTVGLTDGARPPYLLLLVSGGHTQILLVHDVGRYERLGSTIDDALGEAFDKTAKLLGLGFPGGPAVEAAALNGQGDRFKLPRPLAGRAEPHFSFAGLKTAVLHAAKAVEPLTDRDVADLCASFQTAVGETVKERVGRAMVIAAGKLASGAPRRLVVAGGVAANKVLRAALAQVAAANGYELHVPPHALCTDNGAMIAWAGAERFARGLVTDDPFTARARWPLDEQASPVLGAGRLGTKA